MTKLKRNLIIIIVTTSFLVMSALLVIHIVQRIHHYKSGIWECEISDFKKLKKSFDLVSDKLWECYFEEKEKNNIEYLYADGFSKEALRYVCIVNDKEQYTVSVDLTEDLGQAFMMIYDAFLKKNKYYGLHSIRVHEEQVSFMAERYPYYAVIRVTGSSRPNYLVSPEDDFEFYVEKITGNWYQGIQTSTQPRKFVP